MSIVGGALIPPIMGLISDTLSIRLAFTVPVLCYSYILYYGLRGYITSQPVRTQTILNH